MHKFILNFYSNNFVTGKVMEVSSIQDFEVESFALERSTAKLVIEGWISRYPDYDIETNRRKEPYTV